MNGHNDQLVLLPGPYVPRDQTKQNPRHEGVLYEAEEARLRRAQRMTRESISIRGNWTAL